MNDIRIVPDRIKSVGPILSRFIEKYNVKTGTPLKYTNLRSVLEYQKNVITSNVKGESGRIFKYTNPTAFPDSYNCDGCICIDIDNIPDEVADTVFDNFEMLSHVMPNLLAMCFSHKHNLHVFLYDDRFVGNNINKEEYLESANMWMAAFARVVKLKLNIDLREYEKALDKTGSEIYQAVFLCKTDYKWNDYCSVVALDKGDIKKLKAEYHLLFKTFIHNFNSNSVNEVMRIKRDENTIFNVEVPRVIDKHVSFGNWSGNDLRRMIASNILIYCDGDKNKAREIVKENFDGKTITEINSWLRNNYESFYDKSLYDWLFVESKDKIILDKKQYLNDMNILETYKEDKYLYIVSNTNTGKTEWSKRVITNNDNVIVLYPNKALRDGKKKGVEDYTYENNVSELNKNQSANISIDLFVRMYEEDDMADKTVIVDESHLLQDYSGMQGRREIIKETIKLMRKAEKVIFMSATPKKDIDLFPFKIVRYEKIQQQKVYVHCTMLEVDKIEKGNKISKTNAVYNHMVKFIDDKLFARDKKCIVFSDKGQDKWLKYGLQKYMDEKLCGRYRSKDETIDCKNSINNENKLIYPITLATRYLGVGVEIKNESEGHIVMNLDEGFDIAFIEQCIGRFRDAEVVHVYLFASREPGMKFEKDLNMLKELNEKYYMELYDEEDDMNRLNILKAKKLNAYDTFEGDESLNKAVGMLLANNIVDGMIHSTFLDVHMMGKRLPYDKFNVKIKSEKLNEKQIEANHINYENNEDDMMNHILSLNFSQQQTLFENNIETILNNQIVPYNDRVSARKYMKMIKPIIKRGWELNKWMEFFDNKMSVMCKEKDRMVLYCKWKRGDYSLNDSGDEVLVETKKELEIIFKEVEMLWSKEFLNKALNAVLEINVDDIFEMVLNDNSDAEIKDISYYFNFNSYSEYKKAKKKLKQSETGYTNGKKNAKNCKVVTDKLEKKYGLVNGSEYDSLKSISDAVGVNAESVRRWKKSGYIIEI